MAYDDNAKKLAAKVIGTVESNLNYESVNYNDPITVGIAQWFGVRAANILVRMKATSAWVGVEPSISNQLSSIPATNPFWNSRYLTTAEGESLQPVMANCAAIQIDQLIRDLDVYLDVAVSHGIDPDANTETLIYFFTMYHQGPTAALEVLATVGPTATPDAIHSACLAHEVFDAYPERYNDAKALIEAGDVTGIDDPDETEAPPVTGGPGGESNYTQNLVYLESVGNNIHLHFKDGQTVTAYPDGRGRFIPRRGSTSLPDPGPIETPPPTGGGGGDTEWVDFMPAGVVTSSYGPRAPIAGLPDSFHYGIDKASPAGGPPATIYAPADMVVTIAQDDLNWTTGTCVKAHTTDNAYTFSFNHMQYASLVVKVGDTVPKGAKIGIEGATGNVSGRHCHVELYEGAIANPWAPPYGNPIDPAPVFAAHGDPL